MSQMIDLRGITWKHTRGVVPVVAAARAMRSRNPGVRISWELPALAAYPEPASWFDQRDQIKALLAAHLVTRSARA